MFPIATLPLDSPLAVLTRTTCCPVSAPAATVTVAVSCVPLLFTEMLLTVNALSSLLLSSSSPSSPLVRTMSEHYFFRAGRFVPVTRRVIVAFALEDAGVIDCTVGRFVAPS